MKKNVITICSAIVLLVTVFSSPAFADITGSTLTATTKYTPGAINTIVYRCDAVTPDYDYMYSVVVNYIAGMNVLSGSMATGEVNGGTFSYNGAVGDAAIARWDGDENLGQGYGSLVNGESGYFTNDVAISSSITGDVVLTYQLFGDGYAAEPHSLTNTLILEDGSESMMFVLGTNGVVIATNEVASVAKGTDFGDLLLGGFVTNTYSITNAGTATLTISGVTTNGSGAASFEILDIPSEIVVGGVSNFTVVFDVSVYGSYSADITMLNNSTNTPYVVNLAGTVFGISTNTGPAVGGNSITITTGTLGSGADITNVTVCGSMATITAQGTNWVEVMLGISTDQYQSILGDIFIQSTSEGDTIFADVYTYERGTNFTFYADASKPDDSGNGQSWATAKQILQSAVDLAIGSGDTVLVTNGTYNTGGMVAPGYPLMMNRVCITNMITVESVKGPANTFIVGEADLASTNGPAAVRCVRLVDGAMLSGFTLTNGHTLTVGDQNTERGGGGVLLYHGGTVSNCVIIGNGCHGRGGGANLHHGGFIVDSILRDNRSVDDGGGALVENGRIENCDIFGNSADNDDGGGLYFYASGSADNVNIYSNSCADAGGGVYMYNGGSISNSTIEDNQSLGGGGGIFLREGAVVDRCTIRYNDAGDGIAEDGGGIWFYNGGIVRNCLIFGNMATNCGGGVMFNAAASNAVLESCTIVANEAEVGGGIRSWGGTIRNCVVYDNTAWGSDDNWSYGGNSPTFEYTCITPTNSIPGGEGCITNNPQFVGSGLDNYRLLPTSPCIDAGTNITGAAIDLDGVPRPLDGDANGTNTVDIGCYEFISNTADSDGDTMTDGWELDHSLDPTDPADQSENPDSDPHNNLQEFIADTDPTDSNDYFCVSSMSNLPPVTVYFESSSNRLYSMLGCSNLIYGSWTNVLGNWPRAGVNGADAMQDTNVPAQGPYYRLEVKLP